MGSSSSDKGPSPAKDTSKPNFHNMTQPQTMQSAMSREKAKKARDSRASWFNGAKKSAEMDVSDLPDAPQFQYSRFTERGEMQEAARTMKEGMENREGLGGVFDDTMKDINGFLGTLEKPEPKKAPHEMSLTETYALQDQLFKETEQYKDVDTLVRDTVNQALNPEDSKATFMDAVRAYDTYADRIRNNRGFPGRVRDFFGFERVPDMGLMQKTLAAGNKAMLDALANGDMQVKNGAYTGDALGVLSNFGQIGFGLASLAKLDPTGLHSAYSGVDALTTLTKAQRNARANGTMAPAAARSALSSINAANPVDGQGRKLMTSLGTTTTKDDEKKLKVPAPYKPRVAPSRKPVKPANMTIGVSHLFGQQKGAKA
ncbi:MAG: hypothetical protein ACNI27_07370 [Desulfovibrio sp.]